MKKDTKFERIRQFFKEVGITALDVDGGYRLDLGLKRKGFNNASMLNGTHEVNFETSVDNNKFMGDIRVSCRIYPRIIRGYRDGAFKEKLKVLIEYDTVSLDNFDYRDILRVGVAAERYGLTLEGKMLKIYNTLKTEQTCSQCTKERCVTPEKTCPTYGNFG